MVNKAALAFIISLYTVSSAQALDYDRVCQYTPSDMTALVGPVAEACALKGSGSNEMPFFGKYITRTGSFEVKSSGKYDFNLETHRATLNGKPGLLTSETSYNMRMKTNDGKVFNVFATLSQDPKDTPFIGTWATDLHSGCKLTNGEYQDDTLIFGKTNIQGYEHACKIAWYGRPLDNEKGTLFVISDCKGEGEKWKGVYGFDFKSSDHAILDGRDYYRCPK